VDVALSVTTVKFRALMSVKSAPSFSHGLRCSLETVLQLVREGSSDWLRRIVAILSDRLPTLNSCLIYFLLS
jgi:hypothetical protein